MNTFHYLELPEFEKNENIKNGEYPNLVEYEIKKQNTIFTFGVAPCGIYIYDFFKDNQFNEEVFKILLKDVKQHNGRGDYSGIIDKEKLFPSYHKYLDDKNVKFNKNKTRIDKSETCGYAFSNNTKYTVINEEKPYYKNNKKEIHQLLDKPIIKPINKILNHFWDLQKPNYIFGYWNNMIINSNTVAAVHSDERNKDNLSCLVCLSTNENELPQSNLNLIDYKISIPMMSNKSILIMNLKNIRHSNNPISKELLKYRHSIVFYNK